MLIADLLMENKDKKQLSVQTFGNWIIKTSNTPQQITAITGPTARYVAIATHKNPRYKDLYYYGVGDSPEEARENALSKTKEEDRPVDLNKFKLFVADFNVDFGRQYSDPRSGNYFKFVKDDGTIFLIMASAEYYSQFGSDLEDLGFQKASIRVESGIDRVGLLAVQIPKPVMRETGLIPNMRYSLELLPGTDSDGNTVFQLHPDTRTRDSRDKYRMGVPGVTIAGTGVVENINERADDNGNTKCWKGYRKVGLKKKNGKMVNDCRPIKK